MKQALQKQITFKKEHTYREIYQYIVDPDAPDLYLALKPWYALAKGSYLSLNIAATLAACVALIFFSYPEYVDSSNYTNVGNYNFLNILELCSVIFFTVDYIVRFIAADKDALDFVLFDVMNVLDIMTTIPYYLQLIIASSGTDPGGLFRLFFVIRMARCIRLARYHRGMAIIVESLQTSVPLLILFLTIALITLIITSAAIFFSETTRYDAPSGLWYRACPPVRRWFDENMTEIPRPERCVEQVAPIQSITDGMYWSVNVITLNGFQSQAPTSVLGKVVAAITASFGILLFVGPAVIMTANYKQLRSEVHSKQVSKMLGLRATQAMKAQEALRKEMERMYRIHRQELANDQRHHQTMSSGGAPGSAGFGGSRAGGDGLVGGGGALDAAARRMLAVTPVSHTPSGRRSRTNESVADDDAFELEGDPLQDDAATKQKEQQLKKLRALQEALPQGELSGQLRLEVTAEYVPVCVFYTDASQREWRTIFQVREGSHYVYEPLLKLKRNAEGEVLFTDDFNVRTAERILTCYVQMDSPELRTAAKAALVAHGLLDETAAAVEGDVLVQADRSGPVNVYHDYKHLYPDLENIVYLDELPNVTAENTDSVGVRFVVVLPHQHGIEDSIRLLRNTRLAVSVGMRRKQFTLHFPLRMNCIMSSRLIRELVTIAYIRSSDHHQVAYIHPADVSMLLEGFCDQYIPTPSSEVLIVAPYVVDQQIFLALRGCCSNVRLDHIPMEAANSCHRSAHLNPQMVDQSLMEVDLTYLDSLDDAGFGTRIRLHVPMCEEVRFDAYLPLC